MKPFEFPFLTDENIGPDVVTGLRERGCDVRTVRNESALGAPFVGIAYLRPGHISASFVLAVVDAVLQSPVDVEPPFVLVAERREATVRVRVRTGPSWQLVNNQ